MIWERFRELIIGFILKILPKIFEPSSCFQEVSLYFYNLYAYFRAAIEPLLSEDSKQNTLIELVTETIL